MNIEDVKFILNLWSNRFLFNVDVDIDDVIDILVDGVFVDVVVTVFSSSSFCCCCLVSF